MANIELEKTGPLTVDDLMRALLRIFPAVSLQLKDSLHADDKNEFSFCGLFAEFTVYFRDNASSFSKTQIKGIFELVEECLSIENEELQTAVVTCFFENIRGEAFLRKMKKYIGHQTSCHLN
jgi:hypothetical protein